MYLWARKRVQMLDDYTKLSWGSDSETVQEIVALGKKYNLLTSYTSFVVVDSIIRCDTCSPETVNQPSPMPEGVSDYAMGSGAPASLELARYSNGKSTISGSAMIRIYPNPVSDQFSVSFYIDYSEVDLTKSLQFVDMLGRVVKEIDLSTYSSGNHELNLSVDKDLPGLDRANYFIRLTVNHKIKNTRIITIL